MRVGNPLIGLPGLVAGSSEFGIATQRSEFGFRVPFAFDLTTSDYGSVDVPSADYLGLYARGNIDNLLVQEQTSMVSLDLHFIHLVQGQN